MYIYQGLGQMLTKCLRHHQGCSETLKFAYVIYGQPLTSSEVRRTMGTQLCMVLHLLSRYYVHKLYGVLILLMPNITPLRSMID